MMERKLRQNAEDIKYLKRALRESQNRCSFFQNKTERYESIMSSYRAEIADLRARSDCQDRALASLKNL